MIFFRKIKSSFANQKGATAIEYGLIAALIAVVIITALTFVGDEMTSMYSTIASAMDGATN